MSGGLDRRVVKVAGGATAVTLVGGGLVVGGGPVEALSLSATDEASLNAAITTANGSAGADTITISATTITLTADITTIRDELTIIGAGQGSTIIDGADVHRGFYAYNTTGTFSLTVQDMTIQNTYYSHYGAAIAAFGTSLTVSDVTFDGNVVDGYGGAIGVKDTGVGGLSVTITASTFTDNSANEDGGAVFVKTNGSTVSISDSTFTDNYAAYQGGAVAIFDGYDLAATTVSIVDSTFEGNSAYAGGAVYVDVYLPESSTTIERSSFVQNEARNDGGGAVFFQGYGTIDIVDSTFERNTALYGGAYGAAYGGAVYITGAVATIEGTDFVQNESFAGGGALNPYAVASITIRDSSFVGNRSLYSSGGAIYFSYQQASESSAFLIENSTFSANEAATVGGAINANALGVDVVIDQSTFTANTATYTGAIAISGDSSTTVQIRNSTISGNEATSYVGGVYLGGYVPTVASVPAKDRGRDGASRRGGSPQIVPSATIVNSIIWGNTEGVDGGTADLGVDDGEAAVDSSIIGVSNVDVPNAGSGNLFGVENDPLLGALADNGGDTETMLPADDSPAVDAGDSDVASFDTDQRGEARISGDAIDIGAVEVQPEPEPEITTTTTTVAPTTTQGPTTTAAPAVLPPTGGGERTGLLAALVTGLGAVLTLGATRRRRVG